MVYEHLLQITSNPPKSLKINRKSLKIAPILKIAQQNLLKTAQSPNEYYFPVWTVYEQCMNSVWTVY